MTRDFDNMRTNVDNVWEIMRSTEALQDVPSDILDLMRSSAQEKINTMENEEKEAYGCCGGCAGCMKRPSGLVGDPQ